MQNGNARFSTAPKSAPKKYQFFKSGMGFFFLFYLIKG